MKKKDELLGKIAVSGLIGFLGWTAFDTMDTCIDIGRESRERGVNPVELSLEKGRTDVADIYITSGIFNKTNKGGLIPTYLLTQ